MLSKIFADRERMETDADLADVAVLAAGASLLTAVSVEFSGLRFAHAGDFLDPVGGVFVAFCALNLYQRVRMPENRRSIFLFNILMLYLAMSVVFLVYQYAMALLPAYRVSSAIHHSDALIGFDWIGFSQAIHGVPWLSEIFGFCYQNWIRETFLMVMILSYTSQFSRLREFTVSYIFTGMAAITITAFLHEQSYDAIVAYSTPGAHLPTGFTPEVLQKAEQLRDGRDHVLNFSRLIGLVCFPSFHAGAAVLLATATRGVKWLWLPFLAFNVLILLGTITEGGHNFTDVIAGCAIAVGATAAARAYLNWGGARRLAAHLANQSAALLGLGPQVAA